MTLSVADVFRSQFEPELLKELEACPLVEAPAGTVLRQPENKRVKFTPLVLAGAIKVTRIDQSGKEIMLYNIGPGESCFVTIAASLANSFSNIDSVRAVTEAPTVMVSINDAQIRAWNEQYRTWRTFIHQLYNNRFAQFFSLIDDIAFKSVDHRLVNQLKSLSIQKNPIVITHAELAGHLGTAREVVSRLLKRLEMDGKIKLGNKLIEIVRL